MVRIERTYIYIYIIKITTIVISPQSTHSPPVQIWTSGANQNTQLNNVKHSLHNLHPQRN